MKIIHPNGEATQGEIAELQEFAMEGLQRPLPDGSLRIVAHGVKEDPAFAGLSDMNTFVSDPENQMNLAKIEKARSASG